MFGNRCINHTFWTEFLQQTLRDFVSALVFGNFFTHHKNITVLAHFFSHRITQSFAHGHGHHFGAGRNFTRCIIAFMRCNSGERRKSGSSDLSNNWCGRRCSRRRGGLRRNSFPFSTNNSDQGVDGHILSACRHEDFGKDAFIHCFDFHGCLIGFNFSNHITGLNSITFAFKPLGKIALFHRRRQSGHQNIYRHGKNSSQADLSGATLRHHEMV